MKKIWLAFALIFILIFGFVNAGDCGSPYFKSVFCGTLGINYFDSNFVYVNHAKNFVTSTGAIDWNKDVSNDWGVNGSSWDQNLVAYYKFDEMDGVTIFDSVRENNATLWNGATLTSNRLSGNSAVYFDGINDSVSIFKQNLPNFTVSMWINKFNKSGVQTPLDMYGLANIFARIDIDSSNVANFYNYTGSQHVQIGPTQIKLFEWYQLTIVRDNTTSYFYVNGELKGSSSNSIASSGYSTSFLGGSNHNYWFNGLIDEVKVYDRVLTGEEILADYNSYIGSKFIIDSNSIISAQDNSLRDWQTIKVNEDINYSFGKETCGGADIGCIPDKFNEGLVGLWHFNDDVNDSSGNEIHGVRNNSIFTSGLWGSKALRFNGNPDYVSIPNNVNLQFDNNMTISFWSKNTNPLGSTSFAISKKATAWSQATGYLAYFSPGSPGLIDVMAGGAYYKRHQLAMDGDWHFYTIIWKGTEIFVYYDGQLLHGSYSGTPQAFVAGDDPLTVGKREGSSYAVGIMEELSIWNRVLSDEEVFDLYRKGVSRLDLNVFSCSDASCDDVLSSNYFSDVNNNFEMDLNLGKSVYLGYETFFNKNSLFLNNSHITSFLSSVGVSSIAGNVLPEVVFNDLNGNDLFGVVPTFSYIHDGNLSLDFNVFDAYDDRLKLTVRYGTNQNQGTGNILVDDLNVSSENGFICSNFSWSSNSQNCKFDLNTLAISDGEYYLKLELKDDFNAIANFFSTSKFKIDNSAPGINLVNSHSDWNRNIASLTFSCSDFSGCDSISYSVDGGDWFVYSSPIVIAFDGNYKIDFNAVDVKGNKSSVFSENVLVGFNGRLKTYSDLNLPESFFVKDELVRFVYDVNLGVVPTITIADSNGLVLVDSTLMGNISGDVNFGFVDLNTFYFDFVVGDSFGWHSVIIENQVFENEFFVSKLWNDKYVDFDGVEYPFSFDLNVYEGNVLKRWFYLVDQNFVFDRPVNESSLRVLDFNGSHYREVPSQLYDKTVVNGLVTSGNLVFLTTLDKNQTKNFIVNYSSANLLRDHVGELTFSQNNSDLNLTNSFYEILIDINSGGVIKSLKSKIGTSAKLENINLFQFAPMIEQSFQQYFVSNLVTSPSISFESGDLISKIIIEGEIPAVEYNTKYMFFSKNPFYLIDQNIISKSVGNLKIRDSQFKVNNLFEKYLAKDNLTNSSGNLLNDNSIISLGDKNTIALFNSNTLDSFYESLINKNSSKIIANTIGLEDSSSFNLSVRDIFSGLVQVNDYFFTSKLQGVFNPLKDGGDLNDILVSFVNPVDVSFGVVVVTDSNAPVIVSSGVSSGLVDSDANVVCSISAVDNVLIDRVVLNLSGRGVDINFVEMVNFPSVDLNFVIDSSYLFGGDYNCSFFVFDVADNLDFNIVSFSVVDVSAPEFVFVGTNPDSNAGIDPSETINIFARVKEFSGQPDLNLFYKKITDANWTTAEMDLNFYDGSVIYDFNYSFVLEEGIYEYYIIAKDNTNRDSNFGINTFYSFYDYTWDSNTTGFGIKSAGLGLKIEVGKITLINNGDFNLDFKLNSNWDNKYTIFYSVEGIEKEETNQGYLISIPKNLSKTITVSLITKSDPKTDYLDITIDALSTLAELDKKVIEVSVLSQKDGPYMYINWVKKPSVVMWGDNGVEFVATISNRGNADTNSAFYFWEYPSDWVLVSGLEKLSIFPILEYASGGAEIETMLTFNIPNSATLGEVDINFYAGCCNDVDKNQKISALVTVVNTSGTTIEVPSGSGGGSSGGGAGSGSGGFSSGSSGGGLPFTVPQQKDLFFQTNEFFELVRGQDSSFKIKVTNPLTNSMEDLNLRVSGIISSYLNLKEKNIPKLDSNEEFVTEIEITSPKYFTPGEYQLTFTIEGYFFDNYKRKTSFKEERQINLLIHDTNRENAQQYLNDINYFIQNLTARGFKLSNLNELFTKSQKLFNSHSYDELKEAYLEAQKIYDTAIDSYLKQQKISTLVNSSMRQGVDTPNTNRLLSLASLAFSRGEYALALERLKEAELTYSLETKGEFNPVVWAIANIDRIILMAIMLILSGYMFFTGIKLWFLKHKLKDLDSENNLLLNLIQDLQKRAFIENKMSMGEYYDALVQFEKRLARVSQDIINYTTKKNNTLSFKSPITRLSQEKKGLLGTIKETQGLYFNKGLVETRIYRTKIDSLTKRLAVVEQNLVSNELQKTLRIHSAGIDKYFWRVYYKIFK